MFLTVNCGSLGGREIEADLLLPVSLLGKLTLAQEPYRNRFGDFEYCCAISIYSIEMWVDSSMLEVKQGQGDSPTFPSLKNSWIDPRIKESPYGKEIGVVIAAAIDYCNKDILENNLKELCKEMAIILKRQRGNILFLAYFYWSLFIFG